MLTYFTQSVSLKIHSSGLLVKDNRIIYVATKGILFHGQREPKSKYTTYLKISLGENF